MLNPFHTASWQHTGNMANVIRFEFGGSYTPEEIGDHEDFRSVFYDREIDAYVAHSYVSTLFFRYWDTDERGKLYKYVGGQKEYNDTLDNS